MTARLSGVLSPGVLLANGEYQVTKVLGQGGFGITYQGVDTKLNRPVAIKEFFPEGCWRSGATVVSAGRWDRVTYKSAKERFLQEGRTLGQFNYPGIVRVYYYFEENNTAYMVMEYLQGQTLAALLKSRGGRLIEADALEYIRVVGEALAVVHHSQMLHQDIKPDNVMLAEDGRAVLIDFGAARDFAGRQTTHVTTLFTPGYAPLEQYGQALKCADYTDIYALGATLYHLLVGKIPVSAIERAAGLELKAIKATEPEISDRTSRAVEQAMSMEIAKRPQSVREFLDLLAVDARESRRSKPEVGFYQAVKDPWAIFNPTSKPRTKTSNQSDRWF